MRLGPVEELHHELPRLHRKKSAGSGEELSQVSNKASKNETGWGSPMGVLREAEMLVMDLAQSRPWEEASAVGMASPAALPAPKHARKSQHEVEEEGK